LFKIAHYDVVRRVCEDGGWVAVDPKLGMNHTVATVDVLGFKAEKCLDAE
jgi:hypothetical protein